MDNKISYWIKEIVLTKEPDLSQYKKVEEFKKFDNFIERNYIEEVYEKPRLKVGCRLRKITREWDDAKPWKHIKEKD